MARRTFTSDLQDDGRGAALVVRRRREGSERWKIDDSRFVRERVECGRIVGDRYAMRARREQRAFDARGAGALHARIAAALDLRAKVIDLVHDELVLQAQEQQREQRGED